MNVMRVNKANKRYEHMYDISAMPSLADRTYEPNT